jgi:hypothetical protein
MEVAKIQSKRKAAKKQLEKTKINKNISTFIMKRKTLGNLGSKDLINGKSLNSTVGYKAANNNFEIKTSNNNF